MRDRSNQPDKEAAGRLKRVVRPGRPAAFSLVELLVAVAVVGLLLSILVPALGRARGHARLVLCRTRLRSLTLGCLLYASDHESRLPVEDRLHNPHLDLTRLLGGANYGTPARDFYCPSETRDQWRLSPQNVQEGNISYFYYCFRQRAANRYLSNFLLKSLPWPRRLDTTMASDTWVFSDGWFSDMPTAHHWYPKGVNYSVLDGSVRMVGQSPRRYFK